MLDDTTDKTILDLDTVLDDQGGGGSGALARGAARPVDTGARRFRHGDAIGNLRILSPLGEGEMGSTYIARHPILRTSFAVKTFKASRDDVFKEAYLAARVDSPYVVPIVDADYMFDEESGSERIPYLVQRYVDGLDLKEVVTAFQAAGRTVPPGLAARIVADVAQGLHACHKAGVVHCDVKPSNIFLHGSGISMLGDFGIAQTALRRASDATTLTGSPAFMPPEYWRGEATDRRSDIYALGITAHQILTGAPPFHGRSAGEWRDAHLGRAYCPPPPKGPREAYLFSVIARMLEKDVAARPETAEIVATLLEPMIDNLPKLIGRTASSVSVGSVRVDLVVGDLAHMAADVVAIPTAPDMVPTTTAAREALAAAGETACDQTAALAPARMGEVHWTGGGDLGCSHLAHVVAAVDGTVCIQRSLLRLLFGAEHRRIRRIALPPIGTGFGEAPIELAAKAMLESIRTFAAARPQHARHIQIALEHEYDLDVWRSAIDYFSVRTHHGHLQNWEG